MDHRLSRRRLLSAAAAVLTTATVGGCDKANGAKPAPTPTSQPPPNTPVASWALIGGFNRPGVLALRPARLVVFADGEAIADAVYRAQLDPDELKDLVDGLLAALTQPDVQKGRSDAPSVIDAATTRLEVWSGTAPVVVSAEALDELRDTDGYPRALYDARDRLAAVHKSVAETAQPYLADRVRVVAEPAGTDASETRTWPVEVTLGPADDKSVQRADLTGEAARSAVRMLTRDLDQRGAWPAYRTGGGKLIQASWRYLLPNE